jgi:cytochrome c2
MPNFWPTPIDPDSKAVARPGTPEYRQGERRREEEVTAIAAFLIKRSTPNFEPSPAVAVASVEEGKRVFESVGCRGCHSADPPGERRGNFGARERDRAPNLYGIGDKVNEAWLRAWVQNPAALWSGTRMPNLRLTDAEAANVAAYLMSLRNPQTRLAEAPAVLRDPPDDLVAEGQRLIGHYGCYGCHQIAGFESASPIAPELGGHARKDVTTLDFGYAVPDHHEHTWETFVTWKIDAPRIYERDRIPLRMADFDLSPREIRALLVFLKGLQTDRVASAYRPESNTRIAQLQEGRQIVEDYNCRGCHLIEGRGGDIRTYYGTRPEDLSMAPPMLRAQGFRVQPEWFYSFLRAPNRIRPWLDVRMPTFNFTEEQVTAVVRYFSVFDGQPFPYQRSPRGAPDLAQLARVDTLVGRLQCTTGCHLLSDEIPPGTTDLTRLAPNLNMARDRLRPEWIGRWIENPARIMPGTKMPQFFGEPFGDSPYRTDYAGDAQETIRALRDYLMNLDQVPAAREAAAAAATAAPAPRPLAAAGSASPARQ